MRLSRVVLPAATAVVTAVTAAAPPAAAAPCPPKAIVLHAAGVPNCAGDGGAFRYDPELVPADAYLALGSRSAGNRTRTVLVVRHLLPHRVYGAHLHVNPCGTEPSAAGPHFQQVPDPVQPSTDPAYANPSNEVWLDVHTDADGAAVARSVNPWTYRTPPRSLVLHAEGTHTDPGHAGTAGARTACLTLDVRS